MSSPEDNHSANNCDVCGGKATVFVSLVKNGQQVVMSFCQKHAQAAGLFNPKAYGLVGSHEPEDKPLSRLIVCEHCGFTHHDFNRMGRFGCSHCYEVFGKELLPILKQIQVGTKHIGKVPESHLDKAALENRLNTLNLELNEAIRSEHFEEAAHVRDEIAHLQQIQEHLKKI